MTSPKDRSEQRAAGRPDRTPVRWVVQPAGPHRWIARDSLKLRFTEQTDQTIHPTRQAAQHAADQHNAAHTTHMAARTHQPTLNLEG